MGGLHRSGTTFVADALAEHPQVSGLTSTGAIKDEGQTLQDIFPADDRTTRPGSFGFRAGAHLTEASPGTGPDAADAVWRAWAPYWDLTKDLVLEKSPPNVLRMRYLQALFPSASFVVVLRHPAVVALATRKWSRSPLPLLLRHWVRVGELMRADLAHLRAVSVIRYEDLVGDFPREWRRLTTSLALDEAPLPDPPEPGMNERYLAGWETRLARPVGSARLAARHLEARVRPFGYSLSRPFVAPRPSWLPGLHDPETPDVTPRPRSIQ